MEEAGTSDGLALLNLEPEMKTERERALLVKLDEARREAHRREEELRRAHLEMDALRQKLTDSEKAIIELKESEKARNKLFSRPCPFNTLEDWQKCFDLGYAPGDISIPFDFLSQYGKSRGNSSSLDYAASESTKSSKPSLGNLPISKFDRRWLQDGPSRMFVSQWELTDSAVADLLLSRVFGEGNQLRLNAVVEEGTEALNKIRQAVYNRCYAQGNLMSELDVQFVFTLFLQALLLQAFPCAHLTTADARTVPLRGSLSVKEGSEMVSKEFSGYTDVCVYPSASTAAGKDLNDAVCIIELKQSFDSLMRGRPTKQKDQVLLQLEMLSQMIEDKTKRLRAGLGDLFACSVAIRDPAADDSSNPIFHYADRVYEARSTVLRLLLLASPLEDADYDALLRASTTQVEAEDDADYEPTGSPRPATDAPGKPVPEPPASASAAGPSTRSQPHRSGKPAPSAGHSRPLSEEEEESYEEELRQLRIWDHSRRGLTYLTAEALSSRGNIAADKGPNHPLQHLLVDF